MQKADLDKVFEVARQVAREEIANEMKHGKIAKTLSEAAQGQAKEKVPEKTKREKAIKE